MTLAGRNRLLRLLWTVVTVTIVVSWVWPFVADAVTDQLFFRNLWALAAAFLGSLVSVVVGLVYLLAFRRSPTSSVFFVVIAVVLAGTDAVKFFQLFPPFPASYTMDTLLARTVHAGHLFFVFSFFWAGAYVAGIRSQRHGALVFLSMLFVGGLAWFLPVDVDVMRRALIFPIGVKNNLFVGTLVLLTVTVFNYVYAGVRDRDSRILGSAVAVVMIAAGREFLFYSGSVPTLLAGTVLIVSGTVVYAVRNYRDYLAG